MDRIPAPQAHPPGQTASGHIDQMNATALAADPERGKLLASNRTRPAREIVDTIASEVRGYQSTTVVQDDLTLSVIKHD